MAAGDGCRNSHHRHLSAGYRAIVGPSGYSRRVLFCWGFELLRALLWQLH